MVAILLLIPLLCISFSLYIMNLYNFIVFNDLDIIILISTLFINIVFSYVLLKLLIKHNEIYPTILNIDEFFSLYYGYITFLELFLLAIGLILNSIVNSINIYYLTTGILIMLLFFYITYEYIIQSSKVYLTLESINPYNKHVNLLYFKDDKDFYQIYRSASITYEEDKRYLCLINKGTKRIKRIVKEASEENE